jgi:hypothetical protein
MAYSMSSANRTLASIMYCSETLNALGYAFRIDGVGV